MGPCVWIGRGRRDVGVECVLCATVSGEQDSEEEEGGIGNDMQMNNNNMNNNNHWSG